TFNNSGTLRRSTNTGTAVLGSDIGQGAGNVTLNNTGSIEVQTGTLEVGLNSTSFPTNAGVIDVASGATFSTNNKNLANATTGTIRGSGTVNLTAATLTNSGVIRPGGLNTVGTLNITGVLTNNPSGVLEFELQGTGGGQYDVIAATGNVSLGGTIKANDLAGYQTLTGHTYSIITSGGTITGTPSFASDTGGSYSGAGSPTYVMTATANGAAQFTWSGITDNFWDTASNWTSNHIPTSTEIAVIDGAGVKTVQVRSTGGAQSPRGVMFGSQGGTDNLTIGSGTLDIGLSGMSVPATSTLTLSGGTLSGTGNVITNGAFTWSGGTIQGAAGIATFGASTVGAAPVLNATTWANTGTVTIGGTDRLSLNSSATFNNQTGGTLLLSGTNVNPLVHAGGTGAHVLSNSGLIHKTSSAAQTLLNLGTFNNNASGTLDVDAGTLTMAVGGTHTGTFNVDPGATLSFAAGTHALNAGVSFTGTGALSVAGATLNVNTPLAFSATAPSLSVSSGTVNAASLLTLSDAFTWSGGTIQGAAGLSTSGASTVGAVPVLDATTWANTGTVTIGGTDRLSLTNSATFNNQTGGTLLLSGTNANPLVHAGGSGAHVLSNSGLIHKTSSAAQTLLNAGTFNNTSTGVIAVDAGTLGVGSTTFAQSGTINIATGATFSRAAGFTNTGTLSGTGTIAVGTGASKLVNQGIINPGGTGATGTLAITGDVQLSTGSNLNMELGGAAAGQFDKLTVSGAATLGGMLTSTLINGFVPSGQNFDVITAGSASGSFATSNLPFGINGAIVASLYRLTHTGGTCAGVCWDGGAATTNWTDVGNWAGDVLPGSTDVAYLNLVAGVTVNLANSSQSVKGLNSNANNHLILGTGGVLSLNDSGTTSTLAGNLSISGGTLTANGPLSLANLTQSSGILQGGGAVSVGTFNWTGGTLTGIGAVTVNTALNMPAGISSNAWNYTFLDGKTLTNNGTATLGSNQNMGGNGADLRLLNSAAINNAGTWNINYANINNTGTNVFNNTGTLNIGALGEGGTINTAFVSSGTVNVAGTGMVLGNGGSGNGTFNIASGTTLATSGPTLALGNLVLGGTITGSGSLSVTNSFSQTIGTLGSTLNSISLNQASGNLNVPALTAANAITLSTVAGDVVLNGVQSTTAPGSSIVATSAAGFTNNAGAGALSAGSGGRWLVYAGSPANISKGGLIPTLYQYNTAFGGTVASTGSGFVYASPLYVDANFTGILSSTFGASPAATPGYLLRGLDSGDTATAAAITGSAAYSNWPISASTAAGSYALQYASGLSASAFYSLTPGTSQSYTVNPAILQVIAVTLSGTTSKTYDGTTNASLAPGNFLLNGFISTDSASVTKTTGTYASKSVGNNIQVSTSLASSDFSPGGGTNLSNYILPTSAAGNIGVITPASLTLSGLAAQNKVYDATTVATVSGTLAGVIAGDAVSLATSTATFNNKNVGVAKPVTVTGLSLTGADAGNYSFTPATGATLTADITPASLTLSGLAARNKVYDATTVATLSGTAAFAGVLGTDVVTLSGNASASFADKNVGVAKPINVSGLTLSGVDAGNYALTNTSASATADITPASLTLSGLSAQNKVYDATTVASVSGTLAGVIAGDAVSLATPTGSFNNKNVGSAKPVTVTGLALTGADAGNYSFTSPSGATLSADITPASLTLSGLSAQNKVYDATTVATITGTAAFSGVLGTDVVSLAIPTGSFDDKNVGNAKPVTVSGLTLTGADAGNYRISGAPSGLIADITEAPAVAPLPATTAPILVQALSTVVATTQQQPTQATSQTTTPAAPPPVLAGAPGNSGPLLLANTTQTIGGTANSFGGGSVVDSLPATSAGGGLGAPASGGTAAGGAPAGSSGAAPSAGGSSGSGSGTASGGGGDKPAADKPAADKPSEAKLADDKSASANKDDTKAEDKKEDKKKDEVTPAKKAEGKPAAKKLATCS
ncbi:MAG: hypothetical protein HY848_18125, partial [Betaproteobacteria bacterium]|nr:hypothetical protein [Betaproteobacteria bacterium]